MTDTNPPPFFILTGPPGSGKTTVLDILVRQMSTVAEPARRVLAEQRRIGGTATGDQDPDAFVAQMLNLSEADYDHAAGTTVFDRGLPDLLAFTAYYQLQDQAVRAAIEAHRYRSQVFFFPPWKEIYKNDDERTLDYEGAAAFGELTRSGYLQSGYDLIDVPADTPEVRARFILDRIEN
ncbi:MAG: AAA family ATPase [Pseudomonadota bacterium]